MNPQEEINFLKKELAQKEAFILSMAEERQNMLDAFTCPAVIIGIGKGIVAANRLAREIGAVDGDSCHKSLGSATNACPACMLETTLETGTPNRLEVTTLDKTWDVHWIRLNQNQILHFASDITEQTKTNQSYADIIYNMEIGLQVYRLKNPEDDGSLTLIQINPAAEEATGKNASSIIGKTINEAFPPLLEFNIPAQYATVIRTKNPIDLGNITYSDDNLIQNVFRIKAFPLSGDCVGVTIENITEKIRISKQMQKNQKLESIGTLAGGIAHDFNNLLNAIFGSLEMASVYLSNKDYDAAQKVLAKALPAYERSIGLTKQLLTFSKGGTPNKILTSIETLLNEAIELSLSGSTIQKDIQISTNILNAEVDDNQIHQVLQNLIINARQAMPNGGTIKVIAENIKLPKENSYCLNSGDYISISIIDQGEGIPREIQDKIFEPFFTTKTDGSGLGLATTYSIIKKHNGHIGLTSDSVSGTTFTLLLPACREKIVQSQLSQNDDIKTDDTILIMDDEECVRSMIGEMLELLGYKTLITCTGEEAIAIAKEYKEKGCPIKIAILDLTVVGGMGGAMALKHLLKIDPEIKAIVSSGYAEDPIMAAHTEYGFSAVLSKPYKLDAIRKVLRELTLPA